MILKSEKLFKQFSYIIFTFYIILLVWLVIFKCNFITSVTKTYEYFSSFSLSERFKFHLIPFNDYFSGPFLKNINIIIKDDILNIIFFIPMGLYLTFFLGKKKLFKIVVISLSISVFFEVFQLFSLIGSFSTKDLITNTLGTVIGYFICLLIYKNNNSHIKIIILNIISIIVIIISSCTVLYAIVNTIKNIDIYIDILNRKLT